MDMKNDTMDKVVVDSSSGYNANDTSSNTIMSKTDTLDALVLPPVLTVHYFQTLFSQQKGGRTKSVNKVTSAKATEVFIDPCIIEIRVYALLANLQVHFVPECYPSSGFLGALPAAPFEDGVIGKEEILNMLQRRRNIVNNITFSNIETIKSQDALFVSFVRAKLSRVLNYLLWIYEPCFKVFTQRAIYESIPLKSLASIYIYKQRRYYQDMFKHVQDIEEILCDFLYVLDILYKQCKDRANVTKLQNSDLYSSGSSSNDREISKGDTKSSQMGYISDIINHKSHQFLLGSSITILDIVAYAYFSVFLRLPSNVVPWDCSQISSGAGVFMQHKKEDLFDVIKLKNKDKRYIPECGYSISIETENMSGSSKLEELLKWAKEYTSLLDEYVASFAIASSLYQSSKNLKNDTGMSECLNQLSKIKINCQFASTCFTTPLQVYAGCSSREVKGLSKSLYQESIVPEDNDEKTYLYPYGDFRVLDYMQTDYFYPILYTSAGALLVMAANYKGWI